MHEYIKKLSASLCLLENHIKDIEFKNEIKKLSMSLLCPFEGQDGNLNLRKVLIQVIDVLDILKVAGKVSVMNAEIILNATVKIIEELDQEILHAKSFLIPKFSLSDMSQNILRDRVKENLQNEYLNNFKKDGDIENDIFKFTKIPNSLKQDLSDRSDLSSLSDSPDSKNSEIIKKENVTSLEKKKKEEKVEARTEEKKNINLDLGNNQSEPIVYTVFGDAEQQIINERRVRIMTILKNGGGSLATISKLIPGLNLKTLQRDLIELMRERKVIMLGKKRWAKYYLK